MNQRVFIQKVRSILSDNDGRRWVPAQRYGNRLDEPRLALVPAGNDRIFMRPLERLFKDYHVALYIDVSGSMEGEPERQATAAAHALHYAMERAGCQVTCCGFANTVGDVTEASRKDVRLLFDTLKRAKLGGGTEDYMAIKDAIHRMAGVTGGKIACILSDGDSGDQDRLMASLVQARRAGIIVLALGINGRSITQVYGDRWAVDLHDTQQVYDTLSGLLERQYQRG